MNTEKKKHSVYERFNPSHPRISLGWCVCTIEQADKSVYYPQKEGEPCGFWEIVYDGKRYRRPDTYAEISPFDWTLVSHDKLGEIDFEVLCERIASGCVQWLTVTDICDRLQVSRSTIERWINAHDFPAPILNTPGNMKWEASVVKAWLARCAMKSKVVKVAPVKKDERGADAWWSSLTAGKREALHKASAMAGWEAAVEAGKLVPDLTKECEELRAALKRRTEIEKGNRWFWQGDGTDALDTLSCEVVIFADTLRALLGPEVVPHIFEKEEIKVDRGVVDLMIDALLANEGRSGSEEAFQCWWSNNAGPIRSNSNIVEVRTLCASSALHMARAVLQAIHRSKG